MGSWTISITTNQKEIKREPQTRFFLKGESLRDETGEVYATNAKAYQAATSGVTNQFKQSLSSIASLTPKDNAQLNAAAAKEPSCKALTSA